MCGCQEYCFTVQTNEKWVLICVVRANEMFLTFFCCDLIAPTYCLSAERLIRHRPVKINSPLYLRAGTVRIRDLFERMKTGFLYTSSEIGQKRPGSEDAACSAWKPCHTPHGLFHPFRLPASSPLPSAHLGWDSRVSLGCCLGARLVASGGALSAA